VFNFFTIQLSIAYPVIIIIVIIIILCTIVYIDDIIRCYVHRRY
jgi:hypothetical protein